MPKHDDWNLNEPLRVVIITRPKANLFRVFYNQAISNRQGIFKIVNWFDSESLGLHKHPLLPNAAEIYKSFYGRVFYIPVIHVSNMPE